MPVLVFFALGQVFSTNSKSSGFTLRVQRRYGEHQEGKGKQTEGTHGEIKRTFQGCTRGSAGIRAIPVIGGQNDFVAMIEPIVPPLRFQFKSNGSRRRAPVPNSSPPGVWPRVRGRDAAAFFPAPSGATAKRRTDAAAGCSRLHDRGNRSRNSFRSISVSGASGQEIARSPACPRAAPARAQQREFALQPRGAIRDLVRRGHAVAAFRPFARKTPAHRGEIKPVAHLILSPAERSVEPLEQRLARGPRKRPAELRLFVARRLPDEQRPGSQPPGRPPRACACADSDRTRAGRRDGFRRR